jgi:FAD/FMN-containing dehydrogenase
MMYVLDEEELVPSAMVYPGSTIEVQQIVGWANKYRIPVFPISMGRNCRLSRFSFNRNEYILTSSPCSWLWRSSASRPGLRLD